MGMWGGSVSSKAAESDACRWIYLQQYVNMLRKLLVVGFEQVRGSFERFEMLLCTPLAVSYGHQVAHDVHQFAIIPIGYSLC